jgi:hypothetical protein
VIKNSHFGLCLCLYVDAECIEGTNKKYSNCSLKCVQCELRKEEEEEEAAPATEA